MRHILFAITMLMLCLSVNGQELKVTGSRKAVRTSGDVLVFITPVASLATVLATQDWQGLKQGVFTGVTTLGVTYALKYLVKKERPDFSDNLYLEFDRKFEWPNFDNKEEGQETGNSEEDKSNVKEREVFCKALIKQIGVLADGSLVPCCLDHNGDVVLGNLFHQSLEDILSSPRATALIEGFKHHHASEALCRDCESALARNSFRGKARKQI